MGMTQDYLETLIAGQYRAARWYATASAATVLLGLLIVLASMLLGSRLTGDYLKIVLTIGGGFIASAAAFPAKEIVAIRNRIDLYTRFRLRLDRCSPEEAEKIQTVIWAAIGKVANV